MNGRTEFGASFAAAGISGHWVARDEVGVSPDPKGAYALVLRLEEAVHIELPRVFAGQLRPGWYVYAGSAWGSGGLRARVRRHFLSGKKAHWHIDRLTVGSVDMAALLVPDGHECDIVGKLLGSSHFKIAAAGFGSADCRLCEGHLLAASAP